jgi:hypothetical protein
MNNSKKERERSFIEEDQGVKNISLETGESESEERMWNNSFISFAFKRV